MIEAKKTGHTSKIKIVNCECSAQFRFIQTLYSNYWSNNSTTQHSISFIFFRWSMYFKISFLIEATLDSQTLMNRAHVNTTRLVVSTSVVGDHRALPDQPVLDSNLYPQWIDHDSSSSEVKLKINSWFISWSWFNQQKLVSFRKLVQLPSGKRLRNYGKSPCY